MGIKFIDDLEPGMVLAQAAVVNGKILVNKGFVITEKLIERFQRFKVETVEVVEKKKPVQQSSALSMQVKTFGIGEYVCFQNDKSEYIYILKEGKLNVIVTEAQKITPVLVEKMGKTIATLEGKNINFGEIGAILETPRSASIKAAAKSVVAMIPTAGGGFAHSIQKNPKLGLSIAITLATRMKETNAKITDLDNLLKSIQEKVDYNYKAFLAICTKIGATSAEYRYEKWLRKIHEAAKLSPIYIQALKFARKTILKSSAEESVEQPSFDFDLKNIKEFELGDTICTQGEQGEELYILVSGRLGVYIGSQRVASISKHGSVIGEMAVLLGYKTKRYEKRTATIKAVSDCQLMVISGDQLEEKIQHDPQIITHIVKDLAERLPITNSAYFSTRNEILKQLESLNCSSEFRKLLPLFEENRDKLHLCENEYKLCNLMAKKSAMDYSASLTEFHEKDNLT